MTTSRRWFVLAMLTLGVASPTHAQTVMPEWAGRAHGAWTGSREPQILGAAARFRAARRPSGPLRGALLVCRVHADGNWDLFADPDFRVRFTIGRRSGDVWGSENSRTEVFSFGGVDLRRGDALSFSITDRDVTFDQHIATPRGRYDEEEIRLSAGQAEVECRVVDPGEVERERREALAAADERLRAIEAARPDLRAADLGRPSAAIEAARGALTRAAAWASWEDADARAGRQRFEREEARFTGELVAAVRAAHAAAPRRGAELAVGEATARVVGVECARAPRRRPGETPPPACVVQLELRGPREALLPLDVIDARGGLHDAGAPLAPDAASAEGASRVDVPFSSRFDARGALLRLGPSRELVRLR